MGLGLNMYVSLLQILAAHRVDCCVNYTDNSNQSLFVETHHGIRIWPCARDERRGARL